MIRYLVVPAALLLIGFTAGDCAAEETRGAATQAPPGPLFVQVADVRLGDRMNRIDYQSFDPINGRLYVAGMGAGKLFVFDVNAQQVAHTVDGFPKATGVLAVPSLGKVYLSVPGSGIGAAWSVAMGWLGLSSGRGRVAILDLSSLNEIARLAAGVFPDGIAYDPTEGEIFVSDEIGSAIQVIDAHTNQVIARIDAGGEVGNVQYDPISKRVYAPIQTKNILAVIDPQTHRIIARYPLPGGRHPHGVAISPSAAIGYIACDADDVLLTVDLATGRILEMARLGRDPDVLALDPGLMQLYVASESGTLSSFDISNATAPKSLGNVFVARQAHSVAVDPISHRLYLPLADLDGSSVMRIIQPRERRGVNP
jgi:DNA-binding beta-propeller fold protein YncE